MLTIVRILAPLAFVSALLAACRDTSPPPPTSRASASAAVAPSASVAAAPTLTRVTESSHVCMVNDRFMGSEQIPVSVGGKTYYGCCASCKDKLMNNPEARTALDPVTQHPVDKAAAVIGKTTSGKVVYFESDDTFTRYAARD